MAPRPKPKEIIPTPDNLESENIMCDNKDGKTGIVQPIPVRVQQVNPYFQQKEPNPVITHRMNLQLYANWMMQGKETDICQPLVIPMDKSLTVSMSLNDFATLIMGCDLHYPTYSFYCHTDEVLSHLSSVIMFIVSQEHACKFGDITKQHELADIFFGTAEVSPSRMVDLCTEYDMLHPITVVVAMEYIYRLINSKKIVVTLTNLRRLFIVAMIVAQKFINDETDAYDNGSFSRLLDIDNLILNELELAFLQMIDYNVCISDEQIRILRVSMIYMLSPFLEKELYIH